MNVSACLQNCRNSIVSILLTVVAVSSTPMLVIGQSTKAIDYGTESLVVESADTTYKYNEDGTGEKLSSLRIRLQSEAGARQYSVLAVPFAAATEKPEIEKLIVRHQDGTMTETPPSDAVEMPAPVSQAAPLYSDLKILQIPVRGLRTGDTLEYIFRVVRKNPESPSQFWDRYKFTRNFVVLSETVTLDVPSAKFVQQWSASVKPTVTETAGRKLYVWHTSQLKPTSAGNKKDEDNPEPVKSGDADLAWSTFKTWAEVGEWYRSLSASRAVPNDAVRAQADEITRDAKSDDEKVNALYQFVSTHIRYVGIDFGVGRYQPHTAAEVLVTRYGDCKDKETLFEALLRAKGISSGPALIGVNVELVPDLPSPGSFDHVITTINLPAGRVWADTTPGVAPFQLLIPGLRDKQALVIPQDGAPALFRTPANPPFPFKNQFEAEATLSKDGELTGKVNINFRSDYEILTRAIALNLTSAQWDQGGQYISNSMGFSGTVSNSVFEHSDDLTQPMHIRYDYTKKPFGDWDNFRIVPLIPAIELPETPEKPPAKDIELGSMRTEIAISTIHLPAGFSADLPDAVHVKTPFASLDKTYKLTEGDLILQREIVITKSKVPVASWEEYRKFVKDISLGTEPWIQLTSNSGTAAGPHPPRPSENNPVAERLIQEVVALDRNGDWATAREKLDQAKALNPEQPFLWSNYGYLEMIQNHNDEATTDFRHELAHHPEETFVVTLFAGFLMGRSHKDEALSVLQASFDRDPSQAQVVGMLASIQAQTNLDQAIATLRKAIDSEAKDQQLLGQLASLLIRKGDKADARTTLAKLFDIAGNDPDLLNAAAYLSADADGDLAVAEKASRKSLHILDTQTSSAEIREANQQSFIRTSRLIASWDTLGYILLKEKKTSEALDFLEASWRNNPSALIGLHYAAALEDAGKKSAALRIYTFSASQVHGDPKTNQVLQLLQKRIGRLKKDGTISPAVSKDVLSQEERTFKISIPSPCKSYTSSTLRLQLSSADPPEVLHVGGQSTPESTSAAIKALKLPHLVPDGSDALILRDAVLTCSAGQSKAYVVLMPLGGIDAEKAGK